MPSLKTAHYTKVQGCWFSTQDLLPFIAAFVMIDRIPVFGGRAFPVLDLVPSEKCIYDAYQDLGESLRTREKAREIYNTHVT